MTRLFEAPDPNPSRIFAAVLPIGIQLWEAEREKSSTVWDRKWQCRGGPQVLIALATAKACLELYEHRARMVHDPAHDLLRYLFRSGFSFAATVDDLLDIQAQSSSPCVELHGNMHAPSRWYQIGSADNVRADAEYRRKNATPAMKRFIKGFERIYPELLGNSPKIDVDVVAEVLSNEFEEVWGKCVGAIA